MPSPGKDYMAEYREKHPDYAERNSKMSRARSRADSALRTKYRIEWLLLYKEELKREGIEDA